MVRPILGLSGSSEASDSPITRHRRSFLRSNRLWTTPWISRTSSDLCSFKSEIRRKICQTCPSNLESLNKLLRSQISVTCNAIFTDGLPFFFFFLSTKKIHEREDGPISSVVQLRYSLTRSRLLRWHFNQIVRSVHSQVGDSFLNRFRRERERRANNSRRREVGTD